MHTILLQIVKDHYCPRRYGAKQKFSIIRFLLYVLVPIGIALFILKFVGGIDTDYVPLSLAVFSISAAMLTAQLGLTQSLVLSMDRTSKIGRAKLVLKKRSIMYLDVLRGLYSSISYTIILLLVSLIPLIAIPATEEGSCWYLLCSGIVYAVSVSLGVSILDIVTGVYLVLHDNAEEAAKKITAVFESKKDNYLK